METYLEHIGYLFLVIIILYTIWVIDVAMNYRKENQKANESCRNAKNSCSTIGDNTGCD